MSDLTVDYKGLVVTTSEVKPTAEGANLSDLNNGDEVTFTKSSPNGEKAVFLFKVKEYDNSGV